MKTHKFSAKWKLALLFSLLGVMCCAWRFFAMCSHTYSGMQCKRQLADLAVRIFLYSGDNKGAMPTTGDFDLGILKTEDSQKLYGCPEYHKNHKPDGSLGYIIVPWECKVEDIPDNSPLMYDRSFQTHKGGVYVLTSSLGKVIFVKDKNYFLNFKALNNAILVPEGSPSEAAQEDP